MHSTYYNLRADPFRLSPDPRFCFPHRTYRKAMTYMRHALLRAEGFIIITGQPGMGKTTLINDLFRGLKTDQIRIARLVSTQLQADDLLRLVAYELNLDPAGMDKASVLNRVGHFLKQQHREGKRTLLVVDEAQDVTGEALEELRLLTNIQIDGQQLLQIFLVGQEELRDTVSSPTLVQLHQRVIAAAHLEPLNITETKEYIKHRLQRVGWKGDPLISEQAYGMIHQFSRGIPRQINQICSRLLLHGSIEERHRLGLQDLKIVIDELHGEMLLPLGMQEIADTVVWPPDSQRESYDERPLNRSESTVTAETSRSPATGAATEQWQQEALDDTAGNTNDDSTAERVAVTRPAVTAPMADTAPVAAGHSRTEQQQRRRLTPGIAAIVVLLAGLLAALLVTLNSETGNRLRDSLATRLLSGNQGTLAPEPPATDSATREPLAAEPPDTSVRQTTTDTAAPDTPLAAAAQASTADSDRAADVVVTNDATPGPEAAQPGPAEHNVETKQVETEPVAETPVFSDVELELTANGLLVERQQNDNLKVNLSGDEMFEFNSVKLSDNAAVALVKLADILGKHEETRIHIVGHTDSSGEPGYNLFLSRRRAGVVADYLVSQGLPANRIRSEGRGDLDTRFEEATRYQPDLRRRFEVYIMPLEEEE